MPTLDNDTLDSVNSRLVAAEITIEHLLKIMGQHDANFTSTQGILESFVQNTSGLTGRMMASQAFLCSIISDIAELRVPERLSKSAKRSRVEFEVESMIKLVRIIINLKASTIDCAAELQDGIDQFVNYVEERSQQISRARNGSET